MYEIQSLYVDKISCEVPNILEKFTNSVESGSVLYNNLSFITNLMRWIVFRISSIGAPSNSCFSNSVISCREPKVKKIL